MIAPLRILTRAIRAARYAAARAIAPGHTHPGILDFRTGSFLNRRRVTPEQIALALEQAEGGSLQAQCELFDLMADTWPRLAKNLYELRLSASRATFAVHPYTDGADEPTPTATARADTVESAISQWLPTPGTLELSFEDTLFAAMDALSKGVSILELHWQHTPANTLLPRAAHVVPARAYGWSPTGDQLGLRDSSGHWSEFSPGHFLIGLHGIRTGAPGATAMLRPLTPYWLGILFGWQWLMSHAQLFGAPFRWANYDPSNPQNAERLRDMLENMGACGWAAFPTGTDLKFQEAGQNATQNPQVIIQEMADRACDLLILGQQLSGEAQAAGLGSGAADLQSNVRSERLLSAVQWCSDLLNYQLVPAILRANFGDTTEPPTITPDLSVDENPKELAERDQILLSAGVPLPRSWFYERHNIPEPAPGDPTIGGPAGVAGLGVRQPSAALDWPPQPPIPAPIQNKPISALATPNRQLPTSSPFGSEIRAANHPQQLPKCSPANREAALAGANTTFGPILAQIGAQSSSPEEYQEQLRATLEAISDAQAALASGDDPFALAIIDEIEAIEEKEEATHG